MSISPVSTVIFPKSETAMLSTTWNQPKIMVEEWKYDVCGGIKLTSTLGPIDESKRVKKSNEDFNDGMIKHCQRHYGPRR